MGSSITTTWQKLRIEPELSNEGRSPAALWRLEITHLFGGVPRRLLTAAIEGRLRLVTSRHLLDEFEETLGKEFGFSKGAAVETRSELEVLAEIVETIGEVTSSRSSPERAQGDSRGDAGAVPVTCTGRRNTRRQLGSPCTWISGTRSRSNGNLERAALISHGESGRGSRYGTGLVVRVPGTTREFAALVALNQPGYVGSPYVTAEIAFGLAEQMNLHSVAKGANALLGGMVSDEDVTSYRESFCLNCSTPEQIDVALSRLGGACEGLTVFAQAGVQEATNGVSWQSLRESLLGQYQAEVADATLLLLVLRSELGEQRVFVTYHSGDQGAGWVRLDSGFGDVNPRVLASGAEYVNQPENLGVGLGRVGDVMTIRWTAFLDGSSRVEVPVMVNAVAGHAHRLSAFLDS